MAIGTTAALVGAAVVGAGASLKASHDAKKAAEKQAEAQVEAAQVESGTQQQALEYMQEREAIPTQFREGALTQLGGLYGLEGGVGSQQALVSQARESPLYSAIMGSSEAGQSAILRSASATGGLRSGNVNAALSDFQSRLQERALLTAYDQQLQGLQGMAGLPSNASAIARQMGAIGTTQAQGLTGAGMTSAQGQVASGQALQQGAQGIGDFLMAYAMTQGGI